MSIVSSLLGTSVADYASGYMPQLMLGSFIFCLNNAAYQTLDRKTEYKWVAIPRVGQDDARQYTGPGEDTVKLEGVVYPQYRGGGGQINKIRALAAQGLPQTLIDGAGNVYGRWVVTGVTEKQSNMAALGQPRKQEFTVELLRYDGGPSNLIVSILGALSSASGLTSAVSSATSAVSSAASSAASTVKSFF